MDHDAIRAGDVARVLTGLPDHDVLGAEEIDGVLTVTVIAGRLEAGCPGCGEFSTAVKSVRACKITDVGHGGRVVKLLVWKRSFRCMIEWCLRKTFTQHTDQIAERRRTTTRCRELMGRAGKDRSTASIAAEFGVSWSTAWAAIAAVAKRELAANKTPFPSLVGVDETRFWRRENWLTGIIDLTNSDLTAMVVGRSAASLKAWIVSLTPEQRATISVMVIDPHAGYRAAIRELLPHVTIVGDRFHFEQLTGRAVTDYRRRRIWEQTGHRGRKENPAWRARHDLLRAPRNLTDRRWLRIVHAMYADTGIDGQVEGDLQWVWNGRQLFADIYNNAVDVAHAQRLLIGFYQYVADHPVRELTKVAATISKWETEFLAYFETRLTNGRTEGRNRTIKAVKRTGYGYRSTPNYILKCRYRALRLTSWTTPTKQTLAA
jgi:transposase